MTRCETGRETCVDSGVLTRESEHECADGQSHPDRLYRLDSLGLGDEGSDEEEGIGNQRGEEREHHLHARSDNPKCDEGQQQKTQRRNGGGNGRNKGLGNTECSPWGGRKL